MVPVVQTRFGTGGNCFSACVATLLDLPIEAVPDFENSGTRSWFESARTWLAERKYDLVQLFPGQEFAGYSIGCGVSSRGLRHSVVYRAGKVVHDPHPSGDGLDIHDASFVLLKVPDAE